MSYSPNDLFGRHEPPYPSRQPPRNNSLLVALVLIGLVIGAVVVYPVLRGMGNDGDIDKRVKLARAEAEAVYLKREAELKADEEHATKLFSKLEIAPSAFR